MRTAIFVYRPTTLTINTNETDLQLELLDPPAETDLPAAQTYNINVEPGIYKIVSTYAVGVNSADATVQISPNNKDQFPQPPPPPPNGQTVTDPTAIQAFFAVPNAIGIEDP